MIDESKTLGELLSDPLIGKIAPDAIRKMDLPKEEMWGKSLIQLRKDCFGGNLAAGFETLVRAARSGEWNARRTKAGGVRTWYGFRQPPGTRGKGLISCWFRAVDLSMCGT